MSALMIGGRTVTRDGEVVATLRFSGRQVMVARPGDEPLGRLFATTSEWPYLYDAWTASHPAAPTPSDEVLGTALNLAEGIELLLQKGEE